MNSTVEKQVEGPNNPITARAPNRWIALIFRYPTLLVLAVLIVGFSLASSDFLTTRNLTTLINQQAVVGLVTLAALLPLIAGEFDLSLGYGAGIATMFGAYLAGHGWGLIPMILAVLVLGILVGLFNSLFIVRFNINSFIATLGVGIILSGGTLAISGGEVLFEGIPAGLASFGRDKFLGIALPIWVVLLIALILVYLLEQTPFGRRLYATGGSEQVAYLAGVRTGRIKTLAFVGAGVLVGCAGIAQLATTSSASPTFGPELLLPAYAGAFLGVVAYRPGYFNVPGSIIAILLIAVGYNGLSLIGVPFWGQPLFNGSVLLLSVLGARAESRRVKIG
jgi:ribose transport system permease protein